MCIKIFPSVRGSFIIYNNKAYVKYNLKPIEKFPIPKEIIWGYLFGKNDRIWLTKSGVLYCTAVKSVKIPGEFLNVSVGDVNLDYPGFLCLTKSRTLVLLYYGAPDNLWANNKYRIKTFKIAGIPLQEKISTVHHNKYSIFLLTKKGNVYEFSLNELKKIGDANRGGIINGGTDEMNAFKGVWRGGASISSENIARSLYEYAVVVKRYTSLKLNKPLEFSQCKCLQNAKKLAVTDDCVMFLDKRGKVHYVLNYSEHHRCNVPVSKPKDEIRDLIGDCESDSDDIDYLVSDNKSKKKVTAIEIKGINGLLNNIVDIISGGSDRWSVGLTNTGDVYIWGESGKPRKIKANIMSISTNGGTIFILDKECGFYRGVIIDSINNKIKWKELGKLLLK